MRLCLLPSLTGQVECSHVLVERPVFRKAGKLALLSSLEFSASFCLPFPNKALTSSYVTTILGALIITVAISAIAFCMVGVKRISVSKYQATAECAQVLRFGIALSCFQRADDYRLLTAVLLILSERPSKLLRWISLAITHLACGGASLSQDHL